MEGRTVRWGVGLMKKINWEKQLRTLLAYIYGFLFGLTMMLTGIYIKSPTIAFMAPLGAIIIFHNWRK